MNKAKQRERKTQKAIMASRNQRLFTVTSFQETLALDTCNSIPTISI
jgi:hypothetical protein